MKKLLVFITSSLFLLISSIIAKNVKVTELTVNTGDVDLYVRVAGDLKSDNVLFGIHGGPGGSCDYMLDLEQLCSNKCTVVNFDQRGAGKSGEPKEAYSLDKFADDIEAVRNELGLEKISLFGHSWGGMVALYYAVRYPDNVNRVITMGGVPVNYEVLNKGEQMLGQKAELLIERNIIPAELPKDPVEMLKVIMPVYFSDPEFNAPYEVKNLYFNPAVAQKVMSTVGGWNFDDDARKLTNKVLMLWGEDDPFGLEMGEYNKKVFTSADVKFVLLKNCGHYWHEQEEETLNLLKGFLDN